MRGRSLALLIGLAGITACTKDVAAPVDRCDVGVPAQNTALDTVPGGGIVARGTLATQCGPHNAPAADTGQDTAPGQPIVTPD